MVQINTPQLNTKTIILKNWKFRQVSKAGGKCLVPEWTSSKHGRPATEIHVDLIDNGLIPDPFKERFERDVQWVEMEDWEYQTEFHMSHEDILSKKYHDLVFETLDTFATVYLNDVQVAASDNMFVGQRVHLDEKLLQIGANSLRILFKSAMAESRRLEKIHGPMWVSNGQTSRAQIRKAQYHYGWDWGPQLMTCGPSRDVLIESYNALVEDVYANFTLSDDLKKASISVESSIISTEDESLTVEAKLFDPSGKLVETAKSSITSGEAKFSFTVENPALWYPNGYGNPDMYQVSVTVSSTEVLDKKSISFGLRTAKLIQEPVKDQEGSSFFLRINNIDVYCAGSCWIPAHSFVSLLTDQDYKDWVKLNKEGNQLMLRVWGGGYYEKEIFYEECDKQGVLVWQDFMFACAQYRYDTDFLKSVEKEASYQVKRLRNHPSIVLYAGNNEDYQIAEWFDIGYDPKDTTSDFLHTKFGARHIYERILPAAVEKFSGAIDYHPGSPWGGASSNDPTVGDIHQWNVWHGKQEKYQNWNKLGGRFISEFGMLAFPQMATIDYITDDETEKFPQSKTMDHHNKAMGFERRLALYVMENIGVESMAMADWVYATQLMQSECLAYAYRCWRKEWKAPGQRYIGGSLVWQTNDCWPVTSWAVVDFFKRPKLAYYAIKRESSPVHIGMYRSDVTKRPPWLLIDPRMGKPFDYIPVDYEVEIWGVNSSTEAKDVILYVDIYEVTSGKLVKTLEPKKVTLNANGSTPIVAQLPVESQVDQVVYCRFAPVNAPHEIIARAADWPQPLKYLKFPARHVSAEVLGGGQIKVSTNSPVKGVSLTLPNHPNVLLSDNGVDLFPGDDVTISAPGIATDEKVVLRWYRQEHTK